MAETVIPSALPKIFHKYVGRGSLFSFLQPYEATSPFVKQLNSVYNVAPLSKWGLSIVPMMGVVSGNPPVEKIDINTSGALTMTGAIWTVYALMISPQNAGSRALAAVNFSMACVNGYNCYRRRNYDLAKAAASSK
jgi:hypothetical protein